MQHCPDLVAGQHDKLCGSDFSEDEQLSSEDELELHLPLLLPEELADLGIDSLRLGHHETAIRYLLLAQLRWSEVLAKRLVAGEDVKVSQGAFAFKEALKGTPVLL